MRTLVLSLTFFISLTAASADTLPSNQPNILLFLMDDMGYGDCRAYNPESKVGLPRIEQLAAAGMRFTNAHSPSAVCAPSRYSLMTGNYPWRGRLPNGTWHFHQKSQILPGQQPLGDFLQKAGYQTAFIGKVHLGGTVFSKTTGKPVPFNYDYRDIDFSRKWKDGPADLGFNFSYSLPQGIQGPPYIAFRNGLLDADPAGLKIWQAGRHGNSEIPAEGFGFTSWDSSLAGEHLVRESLGFLDRHFAQAQKDDGGKPFFLLHCTESCHVPHTPPASLDGQPVKGSAGDAHLDMLHEANIQLGLLIDRIESAGELSNTLIIFTSDNGGLARGKPGNHRHGHNSNAPLKGSKATIWEGGHRVPLITRWGDGTPAGSIIPPGTSSEVLVGLQDIFATLAEITGEQISEQAALDSQSFLPALLQEPDLSCRETMLVQANDGDAQGQRLARAVYQGPWKLVLTKDGQPQHLFNLADDLDEKCDLVTDPQNASRVQALQAEHVRIANSKRSTTVKKRVAATQTSFRKPSGVQPAPINAEDLFKPVRRYEIVAKPMKATATYKRLRNGWRITGKSPLTVPFAPADGKPWDISGFRLMGLEVENQQPGVTTVLGKLNNSKPLGWGRHCVGQAVAVAGEQATVGFVFPVTKPAYDGPAVFNDQLGKPNGHRHHWRQFFPEDVVGLMLEIHSSTGTVDLIVNDPFTAWEATPQRERDLQERPYLDHFGQVRAVNWPGKATTEAALKKELRDELADAAEKAKTIRSSRYGGWLDGPQLQATGRFRTEKVDGRWWLVDPDGRLFFSTGVCIAGTEAFTPITWQRLEQNFFAWLPESDDPHYWLTPVKRGGKSFANFPALNAAAALGKNWQQTSREGIHNRMRCWGMNTLGAWSDKKLQQDGQTPYTLLASIWWQTGKKVPSPFRQDFVTDLCKAVAQHAWAKDDPFCLGVFIGNEFEWPDRFTPMVLELPDDDSTKQWVIEQLKQKYKNLAALNAAWQTSLPTWLAAVRPGPKHQQAAAAKDLEPLYLPYAREFFRKSKEAIEQVLPGTLFLGCRCHRGPNVLGRAAVGFADVFSVNVYDSQVRSWQVPEDTDIPVISSEFHFGAVDRGVPSPGLSAVWDQNQRGLAYARYLASALAHPQFVGVHWFEWIDQSAAGRQDRENHAVGFVDVTGRSYHPFVDIVSDVNGRNEQVRASAPTSIESALEKLIAPAGRTAKRPADTQTVAVAKQHNAKGTGPRKPNLVVIMADDLGYADVGFNGCTDIPTPHIDSIATGGVRFTSGYVAYPVCGPSRAAFITGRYGQRFGFERNPLYKTDDPQMGLPRSETTIADSLYAVGYRCGVVGKWHLGAHKTLHPLARGFHDFFGHLGGGHRYFPEALTIRESSDAKDEGQSYQTWILQNHTPVQPRQYLTDEFSEAAVRFISEHADQPFFLFLAYNAPHLPLEATEQYLQRFPQLTGKRKTYAAMVSAVDDGVGDVLAALRQADIDDDTLVFFLSDNGGPHLKNASQNTPLKGGKSDVWEGGYRVPFAARYPRAIPAGTTFDQPVSSLDIFATIAALTDAPLAADRPLDGVNLIPHVRGETSTAPHEAIFIRKFDQQRYAIRCGDHKLVIPAKTSRPQLFDLSADIGEAKNLAWEKPDTVEQLQKRLNEWNSTLIEPAFLGLKMKETSGKKKPAE